MNRSSIIHNISAMNANRMYGINRNHVFQSAMHLASGYRINSARDDASGLSISEKLRKHNGGLSSAVYNTQTGISLMQVADGALQEIHDILQRTNELAIQAANGTNSDMEREMLQNEIEQSLKEIDRIGNSTTFNEIKIFDGNSLHAVNSTTTIPSGTSEMIDLKGNTFYRLGASTALSDDEAKEEIRKGNAIYLNAAGSNTVKKTVWSITVDNPNATGQFSKTVITNNGGKNTYTMGKNEVTNSSSMSLDAIIAAANAYQDYTDRDYQFTRNGNTIEVIHTGADSKNDITGFTMKWCGKEYNAVAARTEDITIPGTVTPQTQAVNGTHYTYTPSSNPSISGNTSSDWVNSKQVHLLLGAEPGQNLSVKFDEINRKSLGLSGLDVSTADNATNAIDLIGTAISKVSKQRSYIGAIDNRLGHTVDSLNNTIENLTSAYAQIRDTDMAKEAVSHTTANILTNFNEAMLSQANQQHSNTLSLLQQT